MLEKKNKNLSKNQKSLPLVLSDLKSRNNEKNVSRTFFGELI